MSSYARDFLMNDKNDIFEFFKNLWMHMGQSLLQVPLIHHSINNFPCLGNITNGTKVCLEAMMWG